MRAINDEQVAKVMIYTRFIYGARIRTRGLSMYNIVISIRVYVAKRWQFDVHTYVYDGSLDVRVICMRSDTRERIYQMIPVIYFVGIEERS